MASTRIRRLEVARYRGIAAPVSLNWEARSLILFGENGTGKSSFVDALEKLLTGSVGLLDGRGAGLSCEKHGPHIRAQKPPQIDATIERGAETATVNLGSPRDVLPAWASDYLEAASAPLYIRRRRQILDFVDAKDMAHTAGVNHPLVTRSIQRWNIEHGPDIREPAEERAKIVDLTVNGSPLEITTAAAACLDHVLQEMRFELGLSIPAKRGEMYTLGDIWPRFLKAANRCAAFRQAAGAALDSINTSWTVRNWASSAHYNEWAKNFSRRDAEDLAGAVIDLFDRVFCDRCKRFVAIVERPAGAWVCKHGCLNYRPKSDTAAASSATQ